MRIWIQAIHQPWLGAVLGLLLLACSPWPAQANNARAMEASQLEQGSRSLTAYLDVLEDPGLALTLPEVQQPGVAGRFTENHLPGDALNYGFTRSAYWLRFTLRNDSDQALERFLEIAANHLSNLDFYQPDGHGALTAIRTGDALAFSTRPYKNRFFVFPLQLAPHSSQVYYLRVHHPTGSVFFPLRLWEPQAFHAYERQDYVSLAWYFGLALGMILFNLLVYLSLREQLYLKYVSFVFFMGSSLLIKSGRAKELLPDGLWWSNLFVYVGYSLTLATLVVFMRHMLNTALIIPRLDRLLKLLIGLLLLGALVFTVALETFARYGVILFMLSTLVILGVGVFCAFQRHRSAYFFVAAFSLVCLGVVVTGLYTMGLLPVNAFTSKALQIGSVADMLLLALAMADRMNQLRQEKAKAQSEALVAQQHLVESLQASEQVLEARVAQRTSELQVLNLKLEALSTTDGLTGVANRRRFDEVLASEWARASRTGQPLALLMMDVDWFKKFNDHYGHQAGDDCLRRVAQVFNNSVRRSGDLVARYGGEEFTILAPATDSASALRLAQTICQSLQAQTLAHEASDFGYVTLSIGVAVWVPQPHESAQGLVKSADEALYQAKAQGRNRAVLASTPRG